MRILLVNDYGYSAGGAEMYFFNLKKGLEQRGHKVFALSSDHARHNAKLMTDFQILESGHCFNLDSYFNAVNYFQFKKILKEVKPDIVHLHNIFYALSPSILFSIKNYRTLMTLHDYYIICPGDKTLPDLSVCTHRFGPTCYKKGCINRWRYAGESIRRAIIKEGLKNVDLLIAPSEYLKNEFVKEGIHNIRFLANAVSFEKIEAPVFADNSSLLYIGRLAKQKGVEYLIKAMPKVIKSHPGIVLKIVGIGSEERALKELTCQLKIDGNVKFLGWFEAAARDLLIRESLILIIPSIWPDVAATVRYEAAVYGKAAIASDVGGLSEFIREGETGFLVPPKDIEALSEKMIYVLSNRGILKKIGDNLNNDIENYRLDKHIAKLEAIYSTL